MVHSKSLQSLPPDGRLLFVSRLVRLFAYGFLSVILVIYLIEIGLTKAQIGILLTATLLGDAVISLWLTTAADQFGRKRILIIGAALMIFAGVLFTFTHNVLLLIIAATIGVISPSGYEIGPFLAIEQAALSQLVPDQFRTRIFAWYYLVGSFATASGSLASGFLVQILYESGRTMAESCRMVIVGYALIGIVLWIIFTRLSGMVEVARKYTAEEKSGQTPVSNKNSGNRCLSRLFGLHRSRKIVFKLSALFAIDSFGGGFILNSIVAYWFHLRFGSEPAVLGSIFFGASVLSGLSGLVAARLAGKIGLVNTMVFTHIPSNILLVLVPLMPTVESAIAVFLLRCSISQMDVPTRQSYTMAVVDPDERSAAGGITNIARALGGSAAPIFTSALLAKVALLNISFFAAGGLKLIYDLLLWREFRSLKPPEERKAGQ